VRRGSAAAAVGNNDGFRLISLFGVRAAAAEMEAAADKNRHAILRTCRSRFLRQR
jgi:hypothetical protein